MGFHLPDIHPTWNFGSNLTKPGSLPSSMFKWASPTPEAEPFPEVLVLEEPQPVDDDLWAGLPSFGKSVKKSKKKKGQAVFDV